MKNDNKQNWLESNTFHHGEFWDIIKLVETSSPDGGPNDDDGLELEHPLGGNMLDNLCIPHTQYGL